MARSSSKTCSNCARLGRDNQELRQRLQRLEQAQRDSDRRIRELEEQLAEARTDSTTSAKPPSSDIVKPPKPAPDPDAPNRSIGGQPGHAPHFRAPFPPEQLTATSAHRLTHCPDCGQPLEPAEQQPRIVQQIDLRPMTFTIEEHQSHTGWCPHCQKAYAAPFPGHIAKGGLLGPQLTALVAYLKGACHASFSTIRTFFRDVLAVPISRGQLAKVIGKVAEALEQPYEELLRLLPEEGVVNADETGHKLNGEQWWTWCFRAELYVLYHIDPQRSGDVLLQVLGEDFDGVLGCDCFSAYRRYMRQCNIVVQFCLAHLIRDVKFLTTLPGAADKAYGERLRELLRELFHIIHERDRFPEAGYRRRLRAKRRQIVMAGTCDVPAGKHCQAMAKRLRKHGAAYFTFITTPAIEPTNNVAEQAIRFVVIDRHITQGTRSEGGNRWSERIWTAIATCALQGSSVYEFLCASVRAFWEGAPPPRLVPT
jgi:transposase